MERPNRKLGKGEQRAVDDFVNRYMKSDSSKTKTEALQEYNREVSKSKTPSSPSSSSNSSSSSRSRSIRTEKPFAVGETCDHYITKDELNSWIVQKLRTEEDFEFTHINNLEYIKDNHLVQPTGDARYAHLIQIGVNYRKNGVFVFANEVIVDDYEEDVILKEGAYDDTAIREFLQIEEDDHSKYITDDGRNLTIPIQEYQVTPKQARDVILFIITNLITLGEDSLYLDYDTTLQIIERRKVCRKLDNNAEEAASSIFHRNNLVDMAFNDIGVDSERIREVKQQYLKYT